MERIWLKSYPADIPAEIDPGAFRSLCDLFDRTVATFGTLPAFVNMGVSVRYDQLDQLTRAFAAYLQGPCGLAPGSRVALMMPNLLQYPVCMFGALRAGCTVVNCNPLYSPRELEHQLTDSGAEAIVIVENFAHVLAEVLPRTCVRHVITSRVGDLLGFPKGPAVSLAVKYLKHMVPPFDLPGAVRLPAALRRGQSLPFRQPDTGPDDIAFLQYTGGTTGVPKGAMLTHRNLVANLEQAHAWLRRVLKEGEETVITALPLYHIFALTANCLTFFKIGGRNVLITNPRDIPTLVKEIGRYRFSAITGVNTLFKAMLNHPDFAKLNFSRLRVSLAGGMALHKAVADRWKEVTGRPLLEAYGLTETSPAVTINPLDLPDYNGAIGLPLPSTVISIRDDQGREVPQGNAGELCVRGPQLMAGYWKRPDETAKVMTDDGYLRTGDIATIDSAGYVRIIDRKKDLILVSGFNVYPNEIEEVVGSHPGILEVCAVGIPDPASGEAVKLFAVKRDSALTAEDVIAHCRRNLTGYKVPRQVEFRTELPKTNVGKILRRALRDEARQATGP